MILVGLNNIRAKAFDLIFIIDFFKENPSQEAI